MNTLIKFVQAAKQVEAVLNTSPITGEEGLKTFIKKYQGATSQGRAKMIDDLFNPICDAQAGHSINSPGVIKNLAALGTFPSQRVGDYMSFGNELTQDMNWMAAFLIASVNGVGTVDIVDFIAMVVVNELQTTEKIELSKLGEDHIAKLPSKRFGAGVPVADEWLDTNGVYTLNTIIEAIRQAFIKKQGDFAYALLAATAGVSTTTNTAATVDSTIVALNAGTTAVIDANANKGFNMSPDVPILFYVRHTHKGLIDQVIRRQSVSNSNDNWEAPRLTNMIIPVYTFNTNFPEQFGAKNAGMLVLPGRKNVWANFKPQRLTTESDFSSASLVVMADQRWNAQAPAAQRRIVNLQA